MVTMVTLSTTNSQSHGNIRSYITITFTDSSTWSKPDQLTVNLARRAHQPPGRLVDEDGLRGLPLAQRAVQGQGGVPFLVRELVRLEEPLHCRQREEGLRLTLLVSSPLLSVIICTEVTLAVQQQ